MRLLSPLAFLLAFASPAVALEPKDVWLVVNKNVPESRQVAEHYIAKRGVPKEVLDQQKEQIYSLASQTAKDRVKAAFIFNRIAEKEGIRVSQEEVNARIVLLAQSYQMAADKFAKELEKRNGISQLYEQILGEKVLDYLQENAKIEDAPAVTPPVAADAPA